MVANPQLWIPEGDQASPPAELSGLVEAINRSRQMLKLPDNWDEEGANRIEEATWKRAISFLSDNAVHLWQDNAIRIDSPVISPVADGSIDLHWNDARRQLLINVPAENEAPLEFYGDDRGHTLVKGTIEASTPVQSTSWLFMRLTK